MNTNDENNCVKHSGKLSVKYESGYLVDIKNQGKVFVIAENIADAYDKLDMFTDEEYVFVQSKSLKCIV